MSHLTVPDENILTKYAQVLINFALNGGQGIKRGETVFLHVPESAKPLLITLNRQVLKSGAHAIIQYMPDEMEKEFYSQADSEQISYFPSKFLKGKIDQADHFLYVLAETNKHELEGIDPKRIMQRQQVFKQYRKWQEKKELSNRFTWTLGLYPTLAMAAESGLSLSQAWQQVIEACYLDQANPLATWSSIQSQIYDYRQRLNSLNISKLRIVAQDTDLLINLGKQRQWLGCDGRNIPSFEIFTSPDWRGASGTIAFNQPLYRYGRQINNIKLTFKQGKVVEALASQGQDLLSEMVTIKNADKIGEVSFTDKRFSRITRFMAETLYDENMGGKNGNFHLALGSAFKESVGSNPITESRSKALGLNSSPIHTDIISTSPFEVMASTESGWQTIFKNGQFTV
jgi:aminopeptidase